MLPLPFKWGLRQNYTHKVPGNWTEKVLGSALLICISNKQHPVGKNVTVELSCSVQLYSSHDGKSFECFSLGTYVSVWQLQLPQYAEEAQVDRSHPGSHVLNGSWEMPEGFRTVGQLRILFPSITVLLALETKCVCAHDCKKPRSYPYHSTSALSTSDILGRNNYTSTNTAECLSGSPCPLLYCDHCLLMPETGSALCTQQLQRMNAG